MGIGKLVLYGTLISALIITLAVWVLPLIVVIPLVLIGGAVLFFTSEIWVPIVFGAAELAETAAEAKMMMGGGHTQAPVQQAAAPAAPRPMAPPPKPHEPIDLKTLAIHGIFVLIGASIYYYLITWLGLPPIPAVATALVIGTLIFGAMRGVGLCIVALWISAALGLEAAIFIGFSFLPIPAIFTTIMISFVALLSLGIPGPRGERSKMVGLVVILCTILFCILAYGTNVLKPYTTSGSLIQKSLDAQKKSWSEVYDSFVTAIPGLITQSQAQIQRQINMASGDYESGVEAQSTKQLGVFLDNIGITNREVPKTGVVDIFGRLRAESFTLSDNAQPLQIKLRCYDDKNPDKTGALRPKDEFTVEEYENVDIDCLFNGKDLAVGSNTIDLEATFNFTTSAYLKTYFMDQETVRSYRRQKQEPLDAFQITDKDPSAIYTPGPMRIGMKAGQQPVSLVAGGDEGPTLTLTIERAWLDGELLNLTELAITVPAGLSIDTINGQAVGTTCSGSSGQEQVCTFGQEFASKLYKDLTAPFITMRITTKTNDAAKLLGGAPLGIRSFKTTIKYTYRIKKPQTVTITETQTP